MNEHSIGWGVTALVLSALLLGCGVWEIWCVLSLPAETLFESHCKTCKQCGGGLLDENGEEQSLCEEGFRLFQEDLRRAKRQ